MKKITIAIDGFSSCGKSTMAKQLANELGYVFVDSGAMYRAITLYFLQNKIDWHNKLALESALGNIKIVLKWNSTHKQSEIFLNEMNVTKEIRTMEVASKVSEVAALKEVRQFAVSQQQQMGKSKGIVMDGRDIGTTVFPDAELKIFVTADIEIRTQRRYEELKIQNPNISLEEVGANLQARDYIDSTRTESPLKQAPDAILLDNSTLSREEQLLLVLSWAHKAMVIE